MEYLLIGYMHNAQHRQMMPSPFFNDRQAGLCHVRAHICEFPIPIILIAIHFEFNAYHRSVPIVHFLKMNVQLGLAQVELLQRTIMARVIPTLIELIGCDIH